jgi:hypothetical protein
MGLETGEKPPIEPYLDNDIFEALRRMLNCNKAAHLNLYRSVLIADMAQ